MYSHIAGILGIIPADMTDLIMVIGTATVIMIITATGLIIEAFTMLMLHGAGSIITGTTITAHTALGITVGIIMNLPMRIMTTILTAIALLALYWAV